MKLKLLQHCCIWYCVKKGFTLQQTWDDLFTVFGQNTFAKRHIRCWWRDFTAGTRTADTIDDRRRSGRPKSARDPDHIKEVKDLVMSDRRINLEQLAHQTDISKRSIHQILCKDLKLSKVAVKFVPKKLTEFDMQHRLDISLAWKDRVTRDPSVLDRIITGYKSWVWAYDPESKAQSCQWIQSKTEPCPMKYWQSRSTLKVMITVFFDQKGIIHIEYSRHTITNIDELERLNQGTSMLCIKSMWSIQMFAVHKHLQVQGGENGQK